MSQLMRDNRDTNIKVDADSSASDVSRPPTVSLQAIAAAPHPSTPQPQPQVLRCQDLEKQLFRKAVAASSPPAPAHSGAIRCTDLERMMFAAIPANAAAAAPRTQQAPKATVTAVTVPKSAASTASPMQHGSVGNVIRTPIGPPPPGFEPRCAGTFPTPRVQSTTTTGTTSPSPKPQPGCCNPPPGFSRPLYKGAGPTGFNNSIVSAISPKPTPKADSFKPCGNSKLALRAARLSSSCHGYPVVQSPCNGPLSSPSPFSTTEVQEGGDTATDQCRGQVDTAGNIKAKMTAVQSSSITAAVPVYYEALCYEPALNADENVWDEVLDALMDVVGDRFLAYRASLEGHGFASNPLRPLCGFDGQAISISCAA